MVGLDLLQRGDVVVLLATVAAAQAGHVVHDQDVVALLVDVATGGRDQMRVAAEAALLAHGLLPRWKGVVNLVNGANLRADFLRISNL